MKRVFLLLAAVAAFSASTFAESSTYQVRLEDMKCGGCLGRATKALKAIEGVSDVQGDLEKKVVTIVFDNEKTNEKNLISALKDAKFANPFEYSSTEVIERTVLFKASQIGCGGCVAKVKKNIGAVEGVIDVDADSSTKLVTVQYDANIVSKKEIVDSFKKFNYYVTSGYTNDVVKYATFTIESAKGHAVQNALATLSDVKGVLDININPENGYTAISFNSNVIADEASLSQAFETAGYKTQSI